MFPLKLRNTPYDQKIANEIRTSDNIIEATPAIPIALNVAAVHTPIPQIKAPRPVIIANKAAKTRQMFT